MSEESKTFEFQAEVKKVLDILINRLYKNREIFLRELISNSADALHRARIVLLEQKENVLDSDAELAINISFDEDENTITISDTGIGMTYDEAVQNLGTVAQSGTLEFLKQLNDSSNNGNLIGQFGVGFYSAFIVANEVIVRSRSIGEDSKGIEWKSDGSGQFTMTYLDNPTRGTDIILSIKDDAKEFLNNFKLESIIKKYSDFVGFPIRMGEDDKIINRQTPIWHQSEEEEVKDEEYNEFYRQMSMDFTEPFHRIKLSVDAPIQFKALLFLPNRRDRMMATSSSHQDYGLKLYSKKILIQEKAKDLLPEYLRFVFGVVDSEDLPLNVSREVIQVDRTIRRITKSITKKIIDELEKIADEDEEKYLEWFSQFGVFIKEGIAQDEKRRERLLRQLRIKTSKSDDKPIPLSEYVDRMSEDQNDILFLLGENLQSLKSSPHLEPFKKLDQEVILFDEPIDTFLMMHVTTFSEKSFKAIDQAEPEPLPKSDEEKEDMGEEISEEEEKDPFLDHLKDILGNRVIKVKYTETLTDSPCRLMSQGAAAFSRMMKYMQDDYTPQAKIMELNADHVIIKGMKSLYEKNPESSLLKQFTFQLLENQELVEGNLQDPASMTDRITKFLELLLKK
ncbi:MAG: molecular chaperone HtpG [Candidatus Hodarchaeales archaeon]|jgi:molecular chaperone HtpG